MVSPITGLAGAWPRLTWILFLFPLVVGLTAASLGRGPDILGAELLLLDIFFVISYYRRKGAGVTVAAAAVPSLPQLAFWFRRMSNGILAVSTFKSVCILSLFMGIYTANKDIFIFFKSIAGQRMRQRWLDHFIENGYERLKAKVNQREIQT